MRQIFSMRQLKAQRDKRGGRILLGDNTGGGTVVLRLIRLQWVGFGF